MLLLPAARWACRRAPGFLGGPRVAGEGVRSIAMEAGGPANNVNYGEAAIMTSIAELDEVGVAHAGAGANRALAALRDPDAGLSALSLCAAELGLLAVNSIGWCIRQVFVSVTK